MSPTQPSPSLARFKFVYGRLGVVRFAVDVPVGIAGGRGRFRAFFPKADIPAPLHKAALEALGGQLAVARSVLILNRMGTDARTT